MFNLSKHNAKIIHLTSRVELHGDDRKGAADIKIAVDVPAEALNGISPGLCESLYRMPGRGDQLALIDKQSDHAFTVLRHPGLEPQKMKQKFPGYEAALGVGQDDDYDEKAFLVDVEVKTFAIEPHEGGSTTVEFTMSVSDIDEEDFVALRRLQVAGEGVVTLTPPTKQAAQTEPAATADTAHDEAA